MRGFDRGARERADRLQHVEVLRRDVLRAHDEAGIGVEHVGVERVDGDVAAVALLQGLARAGALATSGRERSVEARFLPWLYTIAANLGRRADGEPASEPEAT